MPAHEEPGFIVGPFRLDEQNRSLSRAGAPIALGKRALDVLFVLAQAAGEIVGKQELLDKAWPGLIVEENNLQVQISTLRKTLGDAYIVTVPGRGYRLVPIGSTVVSAAGSADRPSIVVLPFKNMSSDMAQEYFADGMSEEIITALARIRPLFVIARNSSLTYKGKAIDVRQIGRELGVRYVVEGGIRRDNDRIRVSAQLADAESGRQLWAERFDRDLSDIFAVQDAITQAMVQALAPTISQAERQRAMRRPPDNLGAWEAYQQALWHWSTQKEENFAVVRDLLQKAAALDSSFAQPHAILAWVYLSQATHGLGPPLPDALERARAEARSAIELDPENAMGHAALAWTFDHQGQWEHALEEASIAAAFSPNDPFAQMTWGRALTFTGRAGEARGLLGDALRLDPHGPTAPTVIHHLGLGCYFQRNYVDAAAWAGRAIREFPKFARPYPVYAAALGQLGRTEEARKALDAALAVSERYFDTVTGARMPYYRPEDHKHLLAGLRKAGWRGSSETSS